MLLPPANEHSHFLVTSAWKASCAASSAFQGGWETWLSALLKVHRKMGSRNVFESGPGARRVWQMSLPRCVRPAPAPARRRPWIDVAMTLAVPYFSLGLEGIPVMMMACQGHGPGTKQGYLWLMENITRATCL